jgi:hypothetical protein
MITELTQEQVSKFPEYVDKWLKIGLSTEPLDFDNAKKEVVRAYKIAGLKPPKYFYHFKSPYEAAIAAAILKDKAQVGDHVGAQVRDQVWAQVGDHVGAQVGDHVWAQVRDQVWAQVGDHVGAQVGDHVWAQVGDQVGAQVWDEVWAQVGDHVGAQVGDQVGAQVWDQVYGNHDSDWLSLYDYMLNELKIKGVEKLEPLMELAKYCGWWSPYKDCVIMQDRPSSIKWDDQKRLHCEDGPSIEYRDGFSVYSWHGVRVPKDWIEDKSSLTSHIALTHENVEQRRAACEIIGWDCILTELNAQTIQKDENPEIGELVEVDIPDIGRERFLRVKCGTGRQFALPVPPDMKTAQQANAWTYGFDDPEDYQLEVRT